MEKSYICLVEFNALKFSPWTIWTLAILTRDEASHIKLSDETPFKHRPRPIHPQDVSAVRKHLQELLGAGVNQGV